MKKIIYALLAVALMAGMTVVVFAGGHGNVANASVKYAVCTVEDCVLKGVHSHGNKTYCAHYYGDGHEYHDYCGVEECVLVGYHEHDGVYCFAHTVNDGHDYHDYCNVSGCVYAGYHEHNGDYCFAHTANDGHGHRNMSKNARGGSCHR